MKMYLKITLTAYLYSFSAPSFSVVHDIKTVGATFSPDTTYAQLGDSIKFLISIGHDVLEITNDSYNTNVTSAFPGGFSFTSGTYFYELTEAKTFYFGCTYHLASSQMKGVIIVTDPSGLNDATVNEFIKIFPNPTSDIINIHTLNPTEDINVEIFNLTGQLVYSVGYINFDSNSIDLSNLNTGVYIIFIRVPDKSKEFKLIKY